MFMRDAAPCRGGREEDDLWRRLGQASLAEAGECAAFAGTLPTQLPEVVRAVRADFDTGGVRMLSIPRDLWLPIPNLADYGITEDRINAAFSYGNYYELPGGGVSLTADTLRQSLGLEFDHYLVVNFAAVEAGIDAIGGVDTELPQDVDGTPQGLP